MRGRDSFASRRLEVSEEWQAATACLREERARRVRPECPLRRNDPS